MFGRWLFRWRGAIGALAFVVVFLLGKPAVSSCLQCIPALALGVLVRFWASGYIGKAGKVNVPGGTARIVTGPYRTFRHPLYIGNALLVAGVLWALRPPLLLAGTVMVLFVVEYVLIVRAEEAALRGAPPDDKTRFSLRRALAEWPTWAAAVAAWGLAGVKALARKG